MKEPMEVIVRPAQKTASIAGRVSLRGVASSASILSCTCAHWSCPSQLPRDGSSLPGRSLA